MSLLFMLTMVTSMRLDYQNTSYYLTHSESLTLPRQRCVLRLRPSVEPPYAIDVSAVPSDAQMEVGGKKINFNEIQNSFESSFADHMPFNSITCNPERKFSGNRFEGGLGLSACYETSKVTALMRDQISGLGKRDKGAENGDSARDKGDVAAKGPPKEIEFEDGSQELERDGTGGSLDVSEVLFFSSFLIYRFLWPHHYLISNHYHIHA